MATKCMICGDSSHTKDICPVKETSNNFKCVNCGGKHKSNLFDCPVRSKVIWYVLSVSNIIFLEKARVLFNVRIKWEISREMNACIISRNAGIVKLMAMELATAI